MVWYGMVWYGDVCILYAMHICKHTKQLFPMGQAPGTRNLQWWPWAIAFRRRCYWAQKVIGFSWIFRGVWDDQLDLEIWRWRGRKKKFVLWNLRWCSEIFKRFSDDVQGIVAGFVMICSQNWKKTWVSSLKETDVWGLKLKIVLWKSEAPIRQINMVIENPPFIGDFDLATFDCQRVILLVQSQSQFYQFYRRKKSLEREKEKLYDLET